MEHTHCEGAHRSKDIFRWLTVALLAALLVVGVVMAVKMLRTPENQVSIMGVGKVSYEPDKAKVTLGVQIDRAETAEVALKELTDRATKIIDSVKEFGLTEADVQTANYSIYPHYEYRNDGGNYVAGYDANQQLIITIANIKDEENRVADVITAATKEGSNQVQGVVYDISNVEELKQEARLLALEDAKKKAAATSNRLGVRLGEITSWWDNVAKAPGINNQPYYYEGYGGGTGASASLVPAGNQEIVVEATITFKVK